MGAIHRRRYLSVDEIANALTVHGGNQAAAAAALSAATGLAISRQSIHERVKHNMRLRRIATECTEEVLDLAESVVLQALRDGDFRAAEFVLRTRGRGRGYTHHDWIPARTNPRLLSDEELDQALERLEAEARAQGLTIDAAPVEPPRALPGAVKRSRG